MVKSYWLAMIALGLVLLSGHVNAQSISHNTGSNATAAKNSPEPKSDTQPPIPATIQNDIQRIANALEAANNKKQPPEEENRANRDLAAQESVANWAPAVFWVAVVELIVTAVGVGLIYKTITETRRIGQAQVRAYVSIKSVQVNFVDIAENMTHAAVSVVAENSGQSPARNFVWRASLQYIGGGQARKRGENGPWVLSPGKPIAARGELDGDSTVVDDMLIDKFYKRAGSGNLNSEISGFSA
jgi:hypothetical protein